MRYKWTMWYFPKVTVKRSTLSPSPLSPLLITCQEHGCDALCSGNYLGQEGQGHPERFRMVPVQNLITGDFMEPPTLYCSSSPDFIHIRQKEPILLKSLLSVVRGKLGRGAVLLQMWDVHISSLSGRFNTILVPSCFFFPIAFNAAYDVSWPTSFKVFQYLSFFSFCFSILLTLSKLSFNFFKKGYSFRKWIQVTEKNEKYQQLAVFTKLV